MRRFRKRREEQYEKKNVNNVLAIMTCVTFIWSTGADAKAEGIGEDISFSELLTESALVGIAELQTRGIYLAEGNSIINKISTSKIGAGGSTTAAVKCKVQVVPLVEKLSNGTWNYVTSWTVTTASGYSAMASKSITVGTGYYYRVRCTHSAATDVSSSCTSALWMGN